MSGIQKLSDMIGKTVYEQYAGNTYEHEIEGFRVDSTGIYIELKDGGIINIHRAYVLSGASLIDLATELLLQDVPS